MKNGMGRDMGTTAAERNMEPVEEKRESDER